MRLRGILACSALLLAISGGFWWADATYIVQVPTYQVSQDVKIYLPVTTVGATTMLLKYWVHGGSTYQEAAPLVNVPAGGGIMAFTVKTCDCEDYGQTSGMACLGLYDAIGQVTVEWSKMQVGASVIDSAGSGNVAYNGLSMPVGFSPVGFMSDLLAYGALLVPIAGLIFGFVVVKKAMRR
jgi:hypothetical protein